jgi:hypothetical protein
VIDSHDEHHATVRLYPPIERAEAEDGQAAAVDAVVQQLVRAGVPGNLGRDRLRAWAEAREIALPRSNGALAEVVRGVKEWRQSERLPAPE